jgi:hypothetical protein
MIPFDPATGQLIVPVRVSPEWLKLLEQGVVCTGVTIALGEAHGDYDLRLHGLEQKGAEPQPDEPKPARAARRRTARSKA